MNMWEKQEKEKFKEYQRKPFINFADSMNRAEIGDWDALAKGGFWTTLVIIVGLLLFFSFRF
ncbi:hypothetical protein U9M73_10110 [Paenibacillus phoenicis]|uniref:Phage capsid protein n=2 Tax=Paenibacillus TaxID=44249 RepID=A0ABU5PL15_9BACL|nr:MULTISPECIES: hypothetical protein [Paenibacillus]EES73727.1 hypothetical protein POTG_01434 [Paenibacillus sp. oral taxon 786 str. D14]MCT2196589.1 hypothetical protein [Paenibacillus sp. p3-SID1389]MDU0333127.1 hypothetical protein [Paenibacillus sp. 3LSP]MEA3570352.1 hypothetical protein [Paenibacillus phoenicis]